MKYECVTQRVACAVVVGCFSLVPVAISSGTCLLQSSMSTDVDRAAAPRRTGTTDLTNLDDGEAIVSLLQRRAETQTELDTATTGQSQVQPIKHVSVQTQPRGGTSRTVVVVTEEKREPSYPTQSGAAVRKPEQKEDAGMPSDTDSLLTVLAQDRARRVHVEDAPKTHVSRKHLHKKVGLQQTRAAEVVEDSKYAAFQERTAAQIAGASNNIARVSQNATQIHHESAEEWFVHLSKQVFEEIQDEVMAASGETTANVSLPEPQHVKVTSTVVTVSIASPLEIFSVYSVIYIPIIIALAAYYNRGMKNADLAVIGPFIMCASSVANDMANKSLAMLMDSPDAISAIQGLSIFIGVGIYCLIQQYRQRATMNLRSLLPWIFCVAPLFAGKFLLAQEVARYCSLSEAVVFKSLSTPCTLLIELLVMPGALKPFSSSSSNAAVCLTVVGAVFFSMSRPSFTSIGIGVAILNAFVGVFYRIAQRRYLGIANDIPISMLACVYGLVLSSVLLPITVMQPDSLQKLQWWITQPSVSHIIALTAISTITVHIAPLAVLHTVPATGIVVFDNMSSVVIIALSVYFFNDHLTGSVMGVSGLALNLCSSFWYAWATQKRSVAEILDPSSKKSLRLATS